ncbi:MAG: tRNA 2-thiouridine(34) synthase MnmA [Thermotogae bacterium]|nr:tRNA 2-thiouridine(34) synthase MnmA [Thermotogota bacterium]
MNDKVALAMSGGVDSSVAAYLLLKEGYEVVGFHMKTVPDEVFNLIPEKKKVCCSPTDTLDAAKVAEQLGIEFHVIHIEEDFRRDVIEYFKSEYIKGRTPNPCAVCNREIKFGLIMDKIMKDTSFNFYSTGHYARRYCETESKRCLLKKGIDPAKDQTYFLATIEPGRLSKILFPIGDYSKEQIRKLAEELGIHVYSKKESQEICFIPDNDYHRFLKEEMKDTVQPGDMVDKNGIVLGTHEGLAFYTIGQRRGLGLATGEKIYVSKLDAEKNEIITAPRKDLYSKGLIASKLNWYIPYEEVEKQYRGRIKCKIRKTSPEAEASLRFLDINRIEVSFNTKQFAITPGQLAVFYHEDTVLGSGFIERAL